MFLSRCFCMNNDSIDDNMTVEKVVYQRQNDNTSDQIHVDISLENDIVVIDIDKYTEEYFKNKTFANKAVCIFNGCDNFYMNCLFSQAKVLFLFNCDKNFVYRNLSKRVFPNLYRLYSTSHPCEYDVMHRHQKNIGYIGYLTPLHYQCYYNQWWDEDIPHVQEMLEDDMMKIYEEYNKVDLYE